MAIAGLVCSLVALASTLLFAFIWSWSRNEQPGAGKYDALGELTLLFLVFLPGIAVVMSLVLASLILSLISIVHALRDGLPYRMAVAGAMVSLASPVVWFVWAPL